MATSNGGSVNESTPPPTFSYAQAAKGRTPPATSPLPPKSSTPMAEASPSLSVSEAKVAWADDAADANTVVDEHEGLPNGLGHKSDAHDESHEKDAGDASPTHNFEGSSASTARDDDASLTTNTQTDATWGAKLDASPSDKKDSERSARREKKQKEPKEEKLAPENFKEAPPPSINFWAVRAQSTAPKPVSPTSAKPAASLEKPKQPEDKQAAKPPMKVPGPRPVKASSAAPLPSVSDTTSWPTPLTATVQSTDDKKKVQDKSERSDAPVPTTSKKSEWVPVTFTHSVKFETPMPSTGRRPGGRPQARGGRGGAGAPGGDRASRHQSGSEGAAEAAERASRSSSLPAKVHRPSSNTHTSQDTSDTSPAHARRSEDVSSGKALQQSNDAKLTLSDASKTLQKFETDASTPLQTGRRRSTATQTDNADDASSKFQQKWKNSRPADAGTLSLGEQESADATSNGKAGHGNRKSDGQNRSGDAATTTHPERGESRRGRGGNRGRGTFNAHLPNGHVASPQMLPPHSAKADTFQRQFAPYPSFASNTRGNFHSSAPRSASIPSPYYGNGFGYPAPFEYGGGMYPNSPAEPMEAQVQMMMLSNGVAAQLNYYFSLDNLIKDMFLRGHMDSQGFVSLAVIGDFKRMKTYTNGSIDLIRTVCSQSPHFELRTGLDGNDRVRVREGWEQWILPMDQRNEAARNEGPPPSKEVNGARSPTSPSHGMPFPGPDGFYSTPFAIPGGFSPLPVASPVNGFSGNNKASNRHSLSAIGNEFFTPQQNFHMTNGAGLRNDTADSFPDDKISQLTVVVREDGNAASKPIFASESSRTFSHGSIDGETLSQEKTPVEPTPAKDEPANVNGSDDREHSEHKERIAEFKKSLTSTSAAKKQQNQHLEVGLYWIKEKDAPQALPPGTMSEPYTHTHAKALQQRALAPEGECPYDMGVLYQFWSHFLIRNFNASMYHEFRQLAHEDASIKDSHTGMANLIKYYGASLASVQLIRDQVLQHYVQLVKDEDPGKDRPAFKQMRISWRDGSLNMRNRKKLYLVIDDELKAQLEG